MAIEVGRHGTVGVVVGSNGTVLTLEMGLVGWRLLPITLATTLVPSTVSDIPDTECVLEGF